MVHVGLHVHPRVVQAFLSSSAVILAFESDGRNTQKDRPSQQRQARSGSDRRLSRACM